MHRYARVPGVEVNEIGDACVAFSPATGGTFELNVECAAVLEALEAGPLDAMGVAEQLSEDAGLPAAELAPVIGACWPFLARAGLVRRL